MVTHFCAQDNETADEHRWTPIKQKAEGKSIASASLLTFFHLRLSACICGFSPVYANLMVACRSGPVVHPIKFAVG
jgi:hypothetical protein